jgi:DNA polymerase III psi subunit
MRVEKSPEEILLENCLAELDIDKAEFYNLKPEEKDTLLKAQYKKLALMVHPDKVSPEERLVATENFKNLTSTYKTAKSLYQKIQAQNASFSTTTHSPFFKPLSKVVLSDEQIKKIFYSVLEENERKIEELKEKYIKCNQSLDEQYRAESTKVWEAQFAQYQANSKKYYQTYQDKCYQNYVDEQYQTYKQSFTETIKDSESQINFHFNKKIDAAWTTTKISLFLFIFIIPLFVALGAFIYYKYLLSDKEEKLRKVNSKACKTKENYQSDARISSKDAWVTNKSTCLSYADWERDIRYNDVATFKANYRESDEWKLADKKLSLLSSEIIQQQLRNQCLYEEAKGWNGDPDDATVFIVDNVKLG